MQFARKRGYDSDSRGPPPASDRRDYGGSGASSYGRSSGPSSFSSMPPMGGGAGRSDDQKLEFLIPSDRVGAVLGVGGRNCKELQGEYHIHLHIDKDEAQTGFRKVILTGGDVANIVRARERIFQMIEDKPPLM